MKRDQRAAGERSVGQTVNAATVDLAEDAFLAPDADDDELVGDRDDART